MKLSVTLPLLLVLIIAQMELVAQEFTQDSKHKLLFKISSGYPGLLQLDELTQPALFNRKAIVPLSTELCYNIFPHISVNFYFGYEYEKISGTLTDFPGPTKSIVTGFGFQVHLLKNFKLSWFDPYTGITLYYYDTTILEKSILPSYRVGANLFIYKNFGANINVGVGAALVEAGLIYGFDF
jgi:hypothetical protein